MSTLRERIVAEYTAAEYRYIAAVALRKAAETMNAEGGFSRAVRQSHANEGDAKADLFLAHKKCEDSGIPVNSSPILPLL